MQTIHNTIKSKIIENLPFWIQDIFITHISKACILMVCYLKQFGTEQTLLKTINVFGACILMVCYLKQFGTEQTLLKTINVFGACILMVCYLKQFGTEQTLLKTINVFGACILSVFKTIWNCREHFENKVSEACALTVFETIRNCREKKRKQLGLELTIDPAPPVGIFRTMNFQKKMIAKFCWGFTELWAFKIRYHLKNCHFPYI